MCEILIRVKDSPLTGDIVFNSQVSRRGDVIHVAEDNWPWGGGEEQSNCWRILKLPEVSYNAGIALASQEPMMYPTHRTTHFRLYSLNFEPDNLSPDLLAYLADDARIQPFFEDHSINDENIMSFFSRKPLISDPGNM